MVYRHQKSHDQCVPSGGIHQDGHVKKTKKKHQKKPNPMTLRTSHNHLVYWLTIDRNDMLKELDQGDAWQTAADIHPAVKYEKNIIFPIIGHAGQLS